MACRKCESEVEALKEQIQYLRRQVEEKDILLAARPMGDNALETLALVKGMTDEEQDEDFDPSEIDGAVEVNRVNAYMRWLHGDALTGIPTARGGRLGAQEE
jgi:hypothetical protein